MIIVGLLVVFGGIPRILVVEVVLVVATGLLYGMCYVVLRIVVKMLLKLLHAAVALIAADCPF